MDKEYKVLTIKLGNFITLCLTVSFKKYKDGSYILKNEKMNYEYYTEEKDINKATKIFAESVIFFLGVAIKERKIFKWLKNWGFEQKLNDKDAFNSALNDAKEKNNKQKKFLEKENNFIVNNESLLFENNLIALENNQMNFSWR